MTKVVAEKLSAQVPKGISLYDRVQIFTNLCSEIGDFAAFANGHLILSTREVNTPLNE